MKKKPFLNTFIFLIPIFFFSTTELLRIYNKDIYLTLREEDGVLEYASVLFYVWASISAYIIAQNAKKHQQHIACSFYIILSFGCFFIAGEEISWGQRIFMYDAPTFFDDNNSQNEVDIHNLEFDNLSIGTLFDYVFLLICLWGIFGYPLFIKYLKEQTSLYFPQPRLSLYFFLAFLGVFWQIEELQIPLDNFLINFQDGQWYQLGTFFFYDPEMAEFLLSVGICFFARHNFPHKKNQNIIYK